MNKYEDWKKEIVEGSLKQPSIERLIPDDREGGFLFFPLNMLLELGKRKDVSVIERKFIDYLLVKELAYTKIKPYACAMDLAHYFGIHRNNVYRTLETLEEKGLIAIIRDGKREIRCRIQRNPKKWKIEASIIGDGKPPNGPKLDGASIIGDGNRQSSVMAGINHPRLHPLNNKEDIKKDLKKVEGEGSPLTPSPSSAFNEENPKPRTPVKPLFLEEQEEERKRGKGKLKYLHTPKKSAEQQRYEYEEYCKKHGIPLEEKKDA